MRPARLTQFIACFVPRSRLDGLCFGTPTHHHPQRQGRTVYHFCSGQIFGVVWWRRCLDDRQHRIFAVVQALGNRQAGHELPGIKKAVAVLAIVNQDGPAGQDGAVDLLLDLVEDLKHRGQKPEHLPPIFWIDAVHRILLSPIRSNSLAAEKILCAS
jgi:hypothetical protein